MFATGGGVLSNLMGENRGYTKIPTQEAAQDEKETAACPELRITVSSREDAWKTRSEARKLDGFGERMKLAGIVKRQLNACELDPLPAPRGYSPAAFLVRQKENLDVTERTKVESAGRILTGAEPKEGMTSIIDEGTWDDLVLVTGSKEKQKTSVASQIDRTATLVGRLFLFGRVARPVDDINTIEMRQDLSKILSSDEDLFDSLCVEFEGLGFNEEHLLSFWNPKQLISGRTDKQFARYAESFDKVVNENSLQLTAHASNEVVKTALQTGITTTIAFGVTPYALSMTGALGNGRVIKYLQSYYTSYSGSAGSLYLLASLIPSPILQTMAGVIRGTVAAVTLKTTWQWNKVDLEYDAMLHARMLGVARFYRRMKAVYQLLINHPEITLNLEHFEKLDSFFKNQKLHKVFNAFESRTFGGNADYVYQRGNVLLPWRQLDDPLVKKEFESAVLAVAEIDTMLSTVKLLKESANEGRGHYCFPKFVKGSSSPVVELTDYWHPMVDRNKAVLNSIMLGEQIPNIVVTGPNAGGKSTSLRSITTAVVMAQSVGIAAAREMSITPFSRVKSSMHTSDNIEAGESLFQSQVKFADKLYVDLQALPKYKFSLCALDEMFTGTKAIDGAAFAYGIAEVLGSVRNSITMFATHYMNVCQLEKDAERFRNFKVSVNKNMEPLFKLEPGQSDQFVAIAVAKRLNLNQSMLGAVEAERKKLEEEALIS